MCFVIILDSFNNEKVQLWEIIRSMCGLGWFSLLWRFKLVDDALFDHVIMSLLVIFMIVHNSVPWKEGLGKPPLCS